MRRRAFIKFLGGAATAWPLVGHAQQAEPIRRIVVLMGAAETAWSRGWLTAFSRRLDELGWRESRNVITQVQWWNDQPEQIRDWATELIARSPDVAVTYTNLALAMLKPIAGNVPIVFVGVGDPVGGRFVSSLAQPCGNRSKKRARDWQSRLQPAVCTMPPRSYTSLHPSRRNRMAVW